MLNANKEAAKKEQAEVEEGKEEERKAEEGKAERKEIKKPKQKFDPNDFGVKVQDLPDHATNRRDTGKYRAVDGVSYVQYDKWGYKI